MPDKPETCSKCGGSIGPLNPGKQIGKTGVMEHTDPKDCVKR